MEMITRTRYINVNKKAYYSNHLMIIVVWHNLFEVEDQLDIFNVTWFSFRLGERLFLCT